MKSLAYKVCLTIVIAFILNTGYAGANYLIYTENNQTVCREYFTYQEVIRNPDPTTVIHYALEQITNNGYGSIHLAAGEYIINKTLLIGSKTTIKGEGIGTKLKFINSGSAEGAIIVNKADGVTLSDLLLVPDETSKIDAGIIVDESGICNINNVFVIGFQKYGIWFRNRTFLSSIENCKIAGNKVSNIYLDDLNSGGRYGDFIPNRISNNWIFGGGKGIEAKNSLVINISGCSFYQTSGNAIHLHSISNAIQISDCRTFQISNDAVLIEDSDEINLSNNIISWHEGHGLVAINSAWGTLSGNLFIDNGSFNTGAKINTSPVDLLPDNFELKNGILLKNITGFHIGGNTIYNWGVCPKMKYGIEEDSLSHNNIITDNAINYFENEAVSSRGQGTIVSNNLSKGEIPYTRLKKLADKQNKITYDTRIIQSYQTELTEEFINSLK